MSDFNESHSPSTKPGQLQFPESRESWGLFIWGDHWLTRAFLSLATTYVGAVVSGLAVPGSGGFAGVLSAVPTSVGWAAVAALAIFPPDAHLSVGWWFGIALLVTASPVVAYIAGREGESIRLENAHLFGKRRRPLGIHWINWLWLWIPYYFIVAEFILSAYLVVSLFVARSGLVFGIGPGLILVSVLLLAHAAPRGVVLLASGYASGLTRGQVALRVVWYLVVLPAVAVGLRTAGFAWMGLKRAILPW